MRESPLRHNTTTVSDLFLTDQSTISHNVVSCGLFGAVKGELLAQARRIDHFFCYRMNRKTSSRHFAHHQRHDHKNAAPSSVHRG